MKYMYPTRLSSSWKLDGSQVNNFMNLIIVNEISTTTLSPDSRTIQ